MNKHVYYLGIFQQLDTVHAVEANSEDEAREILLQQIENGEVGIIDDPEVETHIERVEVEEGKFND